MTLKSAFGWRMEEVASPRQPMFAPDIFSFLGLVFWYILPPILVFASALKYVQVQTSSRPAQSEIPGWLWLNQRRWSSCRRGQERYLTWWWIRDNFANYQRRNTWVTTIATLTAFLQRVMSLGAMTLWPPSGSVTGLFWWILSTTQFIIAVALYCMTQRCTYLSIWHTCRKRGDAWRTVNQRTVLHVYSAIQEGKSCRVLTHCPSARHANRVQYYWLNNWYQLLPQPGRCFRNWHTVHGCTIPVRVALWINFSRTYWVVKVRGGSAPLLWPPLSTLWLRPHLLKSERRLLIAEPMLPQQLWFYFFVSEFIRGSFHK